MEESIFHKRVDFNIFDLIGELGGVIEVFIIVFGIFLYPVSNHSFILKASQMLFYAKTSDESLFAEEEKKPKMENNNDR